MDLKSLNTAVNQIAAEKGIEAGKVLEAIEFALAAAYKKEYRKRTEIIKAKFNPKNQDMKFWQIKVVVDPSEVRIVAPEEEGVEEFAENKNKEKKSSTFSPESEEDVLPRYNPDRHIFIEEAKAIKSDVQLGEELEFPLEVHEDFGRIAAQTAKQVIVQALREAERSSIQQEFVGKEGQIVSGVVQRFERGNVFVDIGRGVGVLFYNESIPNEHYRVGQRMRFYVLAVQNDSRHSSIILSRAHPNFLLKLFELEVPEVADGVVEIKAVIREAGIRSKIAVTSHQEGVDPIGSVVGQKGTRIMAVTNELGNEKIDVVEWSEIPEKFVGNALSPAKVKLVEIMPRREAKVLVAEDQLSLAIGKGGQNVRLAAKLTGWKIDVRSQSNPDQVLEGGIAEIPEEKPAEKAEETEETKTPAENSAPTEEKKLE